MGEGGRESGEMEANKRGHGPWRRGREEERPERERWFRPGPSLLMNVLNLLTRSMNRNGVHVYEYIIDGTRHTTAGAIYSQRIK